MTQIRLYGIVARNAPRAVIFRRGPTKQVLLVAWNTDTDEFEEGQWFKGRIYERRCDLSRAGDLLIYFAAKYRQPYYTWTAISRPPYLTALAVWPKGDAWGGGGHFLKRKAILLNHRPDQMNLADGFSLPKPMNVGRAEYGGLGEDNPVWFERMVRDGWLLVSAGKTSRPDWNAKTWIELRQPIVLEKRSPAAPEKIILRMSVIGIKEREGPWYITEHTVVPSTGAEQSLGRTEWAEWLPSGDLVFSRGPLLFRMSCSRELSEARLIADFSATHFREREAPPEALRWPPP